MRNPLPGSRRHAPARDPPAIRPQSCAGCNREPTLEYTCVPPTAPHRRDARAAASGRGSAGRSGWPCSCRRPRSAPRTREPDRSPACPRELQPLRMAVGNDEGVAPGDSGDHHFDPGFIELARRCEWVASMPPAPGTAAPPGTPFRPGEAGACGGDQRKAGGNRPGSAWTRGTRPGAVRPTWPRRRPWSRSPRAERARPPRRGSPRPASGAGARCGGGRCGGRCRAAPRSRRRSGPG
jgi:hypothetical protein